MKIIFYSYSGVHSAVVAGAAYLGRISTQKAASVQFSRVPFLGCTEKKSELRYLGDDKSGNQIYTLGVKGEMDLIPKAIKSFMQLIAVPPQELIMINTYDSISIMSKWGERLARHGLITMGNFLARLGLKKDFPLLVQKAQSIPLTRITSLDLIRGMMDNNGEMMESGESHEGRNIQRHTGKHRSSTWCGKR